MAGLQVDGSDPVDEALLDATADLVAAFGVRRWSLEDVAARSGLGRTTVYRHFDGRDGLVAAVLARDARRLFAAIADSVEDLDSIDDKLVEGFLVGLRALRHTLIPRLIETDATDALHLLTAGVVLAMARQALVERYQILVAAGTAGAGTGGAVGGAEIVVMAEALVRLAVSFVVMPTSLIDIDDPDEARRHLRQLLRPFLRSA